MTEPARDGSLGLFNLPNKLTSLRLVLAFVLFSLVWVEQWLLAALVFVVAAFTDWLDGYFARKRGLVSSLGRVYDPLVDKVLTNGVFIFFLEKEESGLNAWMVTIIVAREFIVTGLRGFLEEKGVKFGADQLGKLKMFLHCAAIFWILTFLFLTERQIGGPALVWIRDVLNWGTVAITIISGANYVFRALKHLA